MQDLKLVALLAAPLLFTACGDSTTATEGTCQVTEPTRLLAPPGDWQPNEYESNFTGQVVDDRLLYSFQTATPNGTLGDVFLRDLCGGEPELVLSADSGIIGPQVLEFAAEGKVLYGWRDGAMWVVDRLDEPGADTPKPVAGLTIGAGDGNLWAIEGWSQHLLFVRIDSPGGGFYQAAGIGGPTREILTLGATSDAPAVLLDKHVVQQATVDEQLAVHTDDGRIFLHDFATGERTPLAEGARWMRTFAVGERRYMLVQDMGDDTAEPVRLVDIDTSESRQVTINDFVQSSFGRDPEHGWAGGWTAFARDDHGFIALYGPDGTMREGYDVATLDPIEIPDNLGRLGISGAPWVGLILADPTDTVYAAWDPFTGELREWYRGPKPAFDPSQLIWRDGGKLEYTEEIADHVYRVSQYDEVTRATEVVLPRVGDKTVDLEDGRILTAFPAGERTHEVVLIDRETAEETTLITETHDWRYDRDQELIVYTDFADAEPGLWATPIPAR